MKGLHYFCLFDVFSVKNLRVNHKLQEDRIFKQTLPVIDVVASQKIYIYATGTLESGSGTVGLYFFYKKAHLQLHTKCRSFVNLSKKTKIVNYNQIIKKLNESNFFYINAEGYVTGVSILSYDRNGIKETLIKQVDVGGQFPNALAVDVDEERLFVGTLEG